MITSTALRGNTRHVTAHNLSIHSKLLLGGSDIRQIWQLLDLNNAIVERRLKPLGNGVGDQNCYLSIQ